MNTTIQSLVEEAYDKLNMVKIINRDQQEYCVAVLTTLAEEASKNDLKPLPKAMPEWFVTYFNNRGNDAATCWSHMVVLFGTQPSEWWMGLKKGDKFVSESGSVREFSGKVRLQDICGQAFFAHLCSPYTEPTGYDKFMNSLTPEQLELAKRLKIEEGEG